jgi:hypothetical protein
MEATDERPRPSASANICTQCGAKFPSAESLETHRNRAHPSGTPRPERPETQWKTSDPGSERERRSGQARSADRTARSDAAPRDEMRDARSASGDDAPNGPSTAGGPSGNQNSGERHPVGSPALRSEPKDPSERKKDEAKKPVDHRGDHRPPPGQEQKSY